MSRYILAVIFALLLFNLSAQRKAETSDKAYHVNYWVTGTGIIVGGAINFIGQDRILHKTDLEPEFLSTLDVESVNWFDRVAVKQDISGYNRARKTSDFAINVGPILPALLFLDRKMRADWLDITLVYLESQIIAQNTYTWSFLGPTFIERYRPITYFDEIDLDERTWGGNRNSFYSGHVGTITTATFFMVKAYTDYHPEAKSARWWLYPAATVLPAIIGVKRVQALKHFPTDVIAGFVIGAASGILIPELHRKAQLRNLRASLFYNENAKGVAIGLDF